MSRYASALQQALYDRLSAVLGVAVPVLDAAPKDGSVSTYVLVGEALSRAAKRLPDVIEHQLLVDVVTSEERFSTVKDLADSIVNAFEPLPVLAEGQLLSIRFIESRSLRGEGVAKRRMRLRFDARVTDA